MKQTLLCLTILALLGGSQLKPSEVPSAYPSPDTTSRGKIDVKRAIEIALDAVKDRRQEWSQGCDIRLLKRADDWVMYLAPVAMGPGLDVIVTVHPDGSTIVAPLY